MKLLLPVLVACSLFFLSACGEPEGPVRLQDRAGPVADAIADAGELTGELPAETTDTDTEAESRLPCQLECGDRGECWFEEGLPSCVCAADAVKFDGKCVSKDACATTDTPCADSSES